MERDVAATTQNQALNAVVFLYKKLLKVEVGDFSDFPRKPSPFSVPKLFRILVSESHPIVLSIPIPIATPTPISLRQQVHVVTIAKTLACG